jgi:hypothetical protein
VGVDAGGLVARGAIGGLAAGTGFILANMWFAAVHGGPAVAPFIAISTVFHASDAPTMAPAAVPGEVVTGLVVHVALSIGFGMAFALLLGLSPKLRQPAMLVGAALLYGLGLYVLNFQILGRTAFPFFTNPMGPNQAFEAIIHPLIFGGLLIPFFLGAGHATLGRDAR